MQILKGHKKRIYALDFSADGGHLLTGSGDDTARLWDLSTGSEIAQIHTERHSVLHALFVPDQMPRTMLVGTGPQLCLWEPDSGRQSPFPSASGALGFGLDGVLFAVGGSDGVRRWDVPSGKPLDSW